MKSDWFQQLFNTNQANAKIEFWRLTIYQSAK